MIAIIDYGMGNLRSVQKAFEKLGVPAQVTRLPQDILSAKGVVLPGVGAFRQAMDNLGGLSLIEPIRRAIASGKPFLGICLGLQLLFQESDEFGLTEGLGIIPGRVIKFFGAAFDKTPGLSAGAQNGLKIPHMGWNNLHIVKQTPLLVGIPDDFMMYFVHSYYGQPEDNSWIGTTTDYGVQFTSSVARDNVFAFQCHPEKSGEVGLKILDNFSRLALGI
jgi:imidazole glycerol-phosphate synthase subunit HisH